MRPAQRPTTCCFPKYCLQVVRKSSIFSPQNSDQWARWASSLSWSLATTYTGRKCGIAIIATIALRGTHHVYVHHKSYSYQGERSSLVVTNILRSHTGHLLCPASKYFANWIFSNIRWIFWKDFLLGNISIVTWDRKARARFQAASQRGPPSWN